MDKPLTTDENVDIVSIIQETEYGFDDPCSGSIVDYDNDKVYLIFDFNDKAIDSEHVTVDRKTMKVEE